MYWDPFEEIQRDLNRLFSSYKRMASSVSGTVSIPAMDMFDNGKEIVITMDLPGVKKEDVKIRCMGDYIEISAKVSEKKTKRKENYYYSERTASSFKRGISLPVEVDCRRAKSTLKNGVLEIRLPKKKKESGGHLIKIE